jgi:hypothetical protein
MQSKSRAISLQTEEFIIIISDIVFDSSRSLALCFEAAIIKTLKEMKTKYICSGFDETLLQAQL